jgi:DNA-binding CsgD family transcriptional regulator
MRTLRRKSANESIVVELNEAEWELVAEQEHRLLALERACEKVDHENVPSSLQRVASVLPLAVAVEMVVIRLHSADRDALHLVAREGLPSRHVRDLALAPISRAKQRSIFALGGHHSHARALGLQYLAGEWLRVESEVVGSLTVGSRTERRPSAAQQERIGETAALLAVRLLDADRTEKHLRAQSLQVARAAVAEAADLPEGALDVLRPREATVLELYAEGRSVEEIAEFLVISPHTVRTHIKHAFRRLGIHSREEAAELVHADNVTALL